VDWAQRGKRPRRRLHVPSSDTTDRSPPGGRFPQGNPSSSPAVRPAAAGAGPCRPFFAHRVVVRELVPVRWARLASRLAARGRALASVSCRALFFSVFPSSGAAGFGMGMLKYRSAVEHGRAVKRACGVCVLSLGPLRGRRRPRSGRGCRWAGSRERKGTWWMPWRQEATKDVARCDKPRGAASGLRSGDLRMGQPTRACAGTAARIDRAAGRTRGTETSQYPEERTSTESSGPRAGGRDSVSSGERTRTRPAAEGSEPEPAGTPGQSG
jgi:hypothetical protein